jgi:MSHA biogenesis protein MshQ
MNTRVLTYLRVNSWCNAWQWVGVLIITFSSISVSAATYNMTSGVYPPCSSQWVVNGNVYRCAGDASVTLANGDVITSNRPITIAADKGFFLAANTQIGSNANPIAVLSTYGNITSTGLTTINGSLNGGTGNITLASAVISGNVYTVGDIRISGGTINGLVESRDNTIVARDTTFLIGLKGHSGIRIQGGNITGDITLTAANPLELSGVVYTSGRVTGPNQITVNNGSQLGSPTSLVQMTSQAGPIIVDNSLIYGNLRTPDYTTVFVQNNATVYGTCLPQSTPLNACNGSAFQLANYRISHAGTAVSCAAEPVTITAYNGLGVPMAPPAGTQIRLSTSSTLSSWVDGNTFTFNGTATSATKWLRHPAEGNVNIDVTDGARRENPSFDPVLRFVDAILGIYADDQFTPVAAQTAGVPSNIVLRAVRKDVRTGACVARMTGTRTVNLAAECLNPSSCSTGQLMRVNGNTVGANASNTVQNFQAQSLVFNQQGIARVSMEYLDVGQVRLHARVNLPATAQDAAMELRGQSDAFVVKPHALVVQQVQSLSGVQNPSTLKEGNPFLTAGTPFQLSVDARNARGNVTPNFGRETISAVTQLSVKADAVVHPQGGTLTSLSVNGAFSLSGPGIATVSSVKWKQVGSVNIVPTFSETNPAGYLGAGTIPVLTGAVVGRFAPDRYESTTSPLVSACEKEGTPFHYMDAPLRSASYANTAFGVTLTAVDADGDVVTNYDGDLLGNGNVSSTDAYATAEVSLSLSAAQTDLSPRLVDGQGNPLATPLWKKGVMAMQYPQARIARLAVPDGPFYDAALRLHLIDCIDKRSVRNGLSTHDTSGGCGAPKNNTLSLGDFDVVSGRLRLEDAQGPETAALKAPIMLQYWQGDRWTLNTRDSCTQLSRSQLYLPAGSLDVSSHLDVALSGGKTSAQFSLIDSSMVYAQKGVVDVIFSAPTSQATGQFLMSADLQQYPWLVFDWNNNGGIPNTQQCLLPVSDPLRDTDCRVQSRIGFGTYRGHDRVIYWREKLL